MESEGNVTASDDNAINLKRRHGNVAVEYLRWPSAVEWHVFSRACKDTLFSLKIKIFQFLLLSAKSGRQYRRSTSANVLNMRPASPALATSSPSSRGRWTLIPFTRLRLRSSCLRLPLPPPGERKRLLCTRQRWIIIRCVSFSGASCITQLHDCSNGLSFYLSIIINRFSCSK